MSLEGSFGLLGVLLLGAGTLVLAVLAESRRWSDGMAGTTSSTDAVTVPSDRPLLRWAAGRRPALTRVGQALLAAGVAALGVAAVVFAMVALSFGTLD